MADGSDEIQFRVCCMKQCINILCATDKNFVPYCGIMLTSLLENNRTECVSVYLIVDDTVKESSLSQFQQLASHYQQKLEFIHIDPSVFDRYPVYNTQWTSSIYYRLLAAELLPKTVDKIIYLDCDIIVTRSLREMWEIDVDNYAVGAVPDVWAPKSSVYERLGLENDGRYFNSGSLILNLKYWREHQLSRQYIQYITDNFEKLWFNDQDTLNGVLYDQKLLLPVKYNFQVLFLDNTKFATFDSAMQKNISSEQNPLIIHYAASVKPWMVLYYKMPYLKEWRYYRNLSLWKNTPDKLPNKKLLRWLFKRYVLWPTGIVKGNEHMLR